MKKLFTFLVSVIAVTALAQAGSWDDTFNVGTGADVDVYSIQQLSDGKILIAGQFTEYNGQPAERIAKLNEDGSLDTSWVSEYDGPGVAQVMEEPDGKLLLGELFGGLKRLNADGTLDAGFSAPYNFGYDVSFIAKQGDKYIISGVFNIYAGDGFYRNIMRLNYDGSIDTTFPPVQLYGDYARAYVLEDNRIFVVGKIEYHNDTPVGNVFILDEYGALDTSFAQGTGSGNGGIVRCMAVQPDGKYVIGGTFLMINGEEQNLLARLNTDGSLDDSFNPPAGDGIQVMNMVIQADGKIIAGGYFHDAVIDLDPIDDTVPVYFNRFNTDGSIDTTFDTGSNFSNVVLSVALQDDNKILASGWFESFDGEERPRVARLNPGTLSIKDTEAFSVSLYPNPVTDKLTLSLNNLNADAEVVVTDITGKTVHTATYNSAVGAIDMSGLQKGLYIIKVTAGQQSFTSKIIKQ